MNLWQWLTLSSLMLFCYAITAEADEVVCLSAHEVQAQAEYESRLNELLIELSVEIEMERLRIEREQEANEER